MDKWVICLNCGHEYHLESYSKKNGIKCPKCLSKEYEDIDKDDCKKTDWSSDDKW